MELTNLPIIGWLVCINGVEKGRDYQLVMSPNGNGIGSSDNMTVVVKDSDVEPEYHATIFYDERCGKSYIVPGFGKRAVRVNGQILFGVTYLKPYDRIALGTSEYVFIQFGGNFEPANTYVKIKNKQPHIDILSEMSDCVCSPCVGWIIDRATNKMVYRLTSDFNYIGDSENNAAVVYDSNANTFFFMVYNTGTACYVNGMPVNGCVALGGFEELGIGMDRLVFVPFCGDYFRW